MQQQRAVFVPWDDRELKVEFATFRDRLRPGSRETCRVTVAARRGDVGAGAAELLAYMYDRSLDLFAPHDPPRPARRSTPSRPRSGSLQSSLRGGGDLGGGPAQRLSPTLPASTPTLRCRDRLTASAGYGIGGCARGSRRRWWARVVAEAVQAPAPPPSPAAATVGRADAMELDAVSDFRTKAGTVVSRDGRGASATGRGPVELRSDFAETAFWQPHLLTGADGSASFEFTVPDSVTAWNALGARPDQRPARRLASRSRRRSVKELMVRPYLPRFLREGDRARCSRWWSTTPARRPSPARCRFEILDPDTGESLPPAVRPAGRRRAASPFTRRARRRHQPRFPVTAPARVGTVAFSVTARRRRRSRDGELRPLPVLPGRMHLVQSRFVTLHDTRPARAPTSPTWRQPTTRR